MPRIRTIKPDLFDDPDVGLLSPLARWLFVGLFTQADRRGRLLDEPQRLRLRLLGFDLKANVDALLDELAAARMVVRYQVDGHRYLQVRSFEKHQRPHPQETESTIPACSSENVKLNGEQCNFTATSSKGTASKPCTDTGSLILDTGSRTTTLAGEDGFDTFYESYPKHEGKKDAQMAWKKLAPSPELQATILEAIAQQKTGRKWQEGFAPMPATFIRGERWNDAIDAPLSAAFNAGRIPEYGCDWCEHHPRCESPDHHAIKARMEARRDA